MEKWRENLGCSVGKLTDSVESSWNWSRFSLSTALTYSFTTRTLSRIKPLGSQTKSAIQWTVWQNEKSIVYLVDRGSRGYAVPVFQVHVAYQVLANNPVNLVTNHPSPKRNLIRSDSTKFLSGGIPVDEGWAVCVHPEWKSRLTTTGDSLCASVLKETPASFVGRALLDSSLPTQCYSRIRICFFLQCHLMSLMDFVVSSPGCGRSVTDFWGRDAHEAQLRCPDEVDGDIWIWSTKQGLKPKFY
jgi:hypothetical protein